MDNNEYIFPVFPEAVIYIKIINIDNLKIINYIKNLEFRLTSSTLFKKADQFISNNLNIFNDLDFLKEEINKYVNFYLYNIFHYKMDYKITTSWVTKTNYKGFGQKHFHANCFLSGVYYPIGNKNFKIKFYKKNKNMWHVETNKENEFNMEEITFDIINNNTLILFPSHLEHSAECNESNIERYSIAFNINPKGYIGQGDSKIEF